MQMPFGRLTKKMVKDCNRHQLIDPVHELGEVKTKWMRLAIDIISYWGLVYLLIVDCGSWWIAIWKEIQDETAAVITGVLNLGGSGASGIILYRQQYNILLGNPLKNAR